MKGGGGSQTWRAQLCPHCPLPALQTSAPAPAARPLPPRPVRVPAHLTAELANKPLPLAASEWSQLISDHAESGQGRAALGLYRRMRGAGAAPSARALVAALKACGAAADLEAGKGIHIDAIESGHHANTFVATALIGMYIKCGSVADGRRVFERMAPRDAVPWNAMILGYAHTGMGSSALKLYARMREEGVAPDSRTFVGALKACRSMVAQEEKGAGREARKGRWLWRGRALHTELANRGLEADVFVANALVDMYAECGSIEDARSVFEKMKHRDVVSWTSMIAGYARMGMGIAALELYARMQNEGLSPDACFYLAVIRACRSLAAEEEGKVVDGRLLKMSCLGQGRAIHSELAKRGFESDLLVASSLVDMYAKCGSMEDARRVFEGMERRSVVSWTSLIIGYAQMQMGDSALELYARMRREGFMPDARTFIAVLMACGSLSAERDAGTHAGLPKMSFLEQGRAVHAEVVWQGLDSDIFVASNLVNMYAKCGSIDDARQVFEKMRHRNIVSWNSMITGYAQIEMWDSTLELYARMQQEGFTPDARTFIAALMACGGLAAQEEGRGAKHKFPRRSFLLGKALHTELSKGGFESDLYVANALVGMYVRCESIEDACVVFRTMKHRNVVSWNTIIAGYVRMEMGESALQLYAQMQREGFTPNARTFVAAVKACSSLGSLETGKEIQFQICRAGLEGYPFISSCLIDMYSKCGSMMDAQQFFESLHARDSATWNALLGGYSGKGESDHLFSLFDGMQQEGVKPNDITFVSVLNVCNHNGLVEKGQVYFQAMCLEHGICPTGNHFMCMIDLLGRAGQLDEAVASVNKMPFKPDMVTWMTVLGACRKWSNAMTGRNAFDCAMTLDEKFDAAYMLMISIYASSQMWEEIARLEEMRAKV